MSKLTRNLYFATMTAAAVFVQSALATNQHDAHDAITIADLDGETYQNALNIELVNNTNIKQGDDITTLKVTTNRIDASVASNTASVDINRNNISTLNTNVIAAHSRADTALNRADAAQVTANTAQNTATNNQYRLGTNEAKLVEHRGYIDTNWSRTIANEQSAAVNATAISGNRDVIEANKEISDTQYEKVWDLAKYNNNYVVDAWMMTLDNEERLKTTQSEVVANTELLATTTATANRANKVSGNNQTDVRNLYNWAFLITDEHNAMNAYIGVMPEDHESDTPATLYKHAVQGNIHLGSGAQVGDNPNPGDAGFEGYDDPNAKTGMTALGANSRADADRSTAIGSYSTNYEDNTVSFGNDYQPAIEAVEAIEYQAEIPFQEAVVVDGEIWYEEVPYQAEVLAVEAVEAKPEILENNRRLTHVADGVNKNDVVNVNQLNNTAKHLLAGQATWNAKLNSMDNKINTLSDKALHGIAISMATKVFLPDPGKSFRMNVGVAEYEGASALGISGSGRVDDNTALYFGLGTDSGGEHTAVQVGASYQW